MIMSEEIELFRKMLKVCPYCGSTEGFWLGIRLREAYFQCKHCGAIIEAAAVVPLEGKKGKGAEWMKQTLRRLRV